MYTHLVLSLLVFLLSSLTSYTLNNYLRKLAFKRGWVVKPRDMRIDIPPAIRKASHPYKIPLTGGLAFLVAFALSMLVSLALFPDIFTGGEMGLRFAGLLVASMVIGLMGFVDDMRKLGYQIRFLVAGLTMLVLLAFTVYGEVFLLPGGLTVQIGIPELLLLLVWCLGLGNSINLIDGLDGSAAGIVAIGAVWLWLISPTDAFLVTLVLMSILACCIVFLTYNFYPASIFLGSTGTLFLGFVLALITIWPPTREMPNYFFPYAIIIFAVPLVDMALVFFIRLLHGRNPFVANSWHIHDRVLLTGAGRKQAAVVIWALSFCCGLLAYLAFRGVMPYLVAVGLTGLLLLSFYVVVTRLRKLGAAGAEGPGIHATVVPPGNEPSKKCST